MRSKNVIFTGKHLCRSLFLPRLLSLLGFTSYSFRSSQMIFKVALRKNLAKLIGKNSWWSSISMKLETVILQLKNSIRFFPVKFWYKLLWDFILILKTITVLFLLHFDSCRTEAIIIWLTKQIITLSYQSFWDVFVKLLGQNKPAVS